MTQKVRLLAIIGYAILSVSLFLRCNDSLSENKTGSTTNSDIQTDLKSDSSKVVKIVYDFFQAFDNRHSASLKEILQPGSIIIHHDGVKTDINELISIINSAQGWTPREREFKDFEFFGNSSLSVLGFINEVTFLAPSGNQTFRYNESWIFEKQDGSWFPLRVHYSLITSDVHIEG